MYMYMYMYMHMYMYMYMHMYMYLEWRGARMRLCGCLSVWLPNETLCGCLHIYICTPAATQKRPRHTHIYCGVHILLCGCTSKSVWDASTSTCSKMASEDADVVHVHVRLYTRASTCTWVHTSTSVHTHVHACMHARKTCIRAHPDASTAQ